MAEEEKKEILETPAAESAPADEAAKENPTMEADDGKSAAEEPERKEAVEKTDPAEETGTEPVQETKEEEAADGKSGEGKKKSPKKKSALWKRIVKVILWVFGALIALLLLMLIFRDALIKFAVTTIGSKIVGVEITMEQFETSLTRCDVKIANLRIGNPPDFQTKHLLSLGSFYLAIDRHSLFTDEILIKTAEVHDLEINGEITENDDFNVMSIVAGLQKKFAPPKKAKAAAEEKPADPAPAAEPAKPAEPEVQQPADPAPAAPAETAAAPTKPAEKPKKKIVLVKYFCLENIVLNFRDARTKNENIDGFGISLKKLSGSLTEGKVTLDTFYISNPKDYDKQYLLELASVEVDLNSEAFKKSLIHINSVAVSGLRFIAEFQTNNDFNVLDIATTLKTITAPPKVEEPEAAPAAAPAQTAAAPAQTAAAPAQAAPAPAAQPAAQTQSVSKTKSTAANAEDDPGKVDIKQLSVSDSSFTIYHDTIDVPITIPLVLSLDNESFEFDDLDIVDSIYNWAVWLRDQCVGVTDAGQLVLSKGGDLLNSTTETGKKIIDGTTETGNKLIKGTTETGKKIIDGTAEGGKKVLKGVVDVFK